VRDTLIKFGVDPKDLPAHHPEWMGNRVTLHLDDGPGLAKALEFLLPALTDPAVDPLGRDGRWHLAHLPLTIGAEIRRPLIFLGWLTKTRDIINKSFPNAFTWEALPGMYRGVKLNRVQPSQAIALVAFGKLLAPADTPSLYYAFDRRTLLLGASEPALKRTAV